MSFDNDKRAENRDSCKVTLEYSLLDEDCAKGICSHKNFTFDISYSGLGMYSTHPVHQGQKLKVFLRHVSGEPIMTSVRWCSKLSDNVYRVGLKYLK